MSTKSNPPSIKDQAFECPHCGAYTTQYWYNVLADMRKDNATPTIPGCEIREALKNDDKLPAEVKSKHLEWCDKMDTGLIFFGEGKTNYPDEFANNIHLSKSS